MFYHFLARKRGQRLLKDDIDSLKGAWCLTLQIVILTTAVKHKDYGHLHCYGRSVGNAWLYYILEFNHFWVKDKDMAVVSCAILISSRIIWHLVCSNIYILCLKLYWQSKEMKDLIRLPSMIIQNCGTSSSIYPIMAEWWFYVVTTCLIMPNKPNWSNWRWHLFMFNVITDIQTLNFVLNDFLNTANK